MRDRRGVGRQLLRIAVQTEPAAAAGNSLLKDEAAAVAAATKRLGPLLERLVELRWLKRLEMSLPLVQLPSSVLSAWVQRGTFPHLRE